MSELPSINPFDIAARKTSRAAADMHEVQRKLEALDARAKDNRRESIGLGIGTVLGAAVGGVGTALVLRSSIPLAEVPAEDAARFVVAHTTTSEQDLAQARTHISILGAGLGAWIGGHIGVLVAAATDKKR